MKIVYKALGLADTNAYLLSNESTHEAILIDAPRGTLKAFEKNIKKDGLKLVALLITHGHWDHIDGAPEIAALGVPVYAHPADKNWIEDETFMNARLPQEHHFKGTKINHFIEDGDILNFIGEQFEVRHVPGHCPGNVLFYNKRAKVAFVGDIIYKESIGRYDLPGASFDILKNSIQNKIYTLSDDTILFSGHGDETTVGHEKKHNPFVRA